jgi:hypothetical protein
LANALLEDWTPRNQAEAQAIVQHRKASACRDNHPSIDPRGALTVDKRSIRHTRLGVSLVLFVHALRHLGTARAGAYFSVAPFFGAALAVLIQGDVVTWRLIAAGLFMASGVWLHLTEHHGHLHAHR